jgi:hypothetical protein
MIVDEDDNPIYTETTGTKRKKRKRKTKKYK